MSKKRTATSKKSKKGAATSKKGAATSKKRVATSKKRTATSKKRTVTSKKGATSKKSTVTSKKGTATSKKSTAASKKPLNLQSGGPVCHTEASHVPTRATSRSRRAESRRAGSRRAGSRRAGSRVAPGGGVLAETMSFGPPRVRINYLVPADRQPRDDYLSAIQNAAVHLQRFYAEQLSGNSFLLHDPVVEVFGTSHNASFYSTNPAGEHQSHWFFNNVRNDAFAVTDGKFFDDRFTWIYYIDAPHDPATGGGAGTSSVAVLPRQDLDGLLGAFNNACRWVGGLGHELGHALGLPHPDGCDANPNSRQDCRSLMFLGYPDYPDTFFTDEHRTILSDSLFIRPVELFDPAFDCAGGL